MTISQLIFRARQRVSSDKPARRYATQTEFAFALGRDVQTVNRLERGKSSPSDEDLAAIITLAELPADYFEQAA